MRRASDGAQQCLASRRTAKSLCAQGGKCHGRDGTIYVQNSTVSIRSWYAQSYTSEYQPVSGVKQTKVE